MNLNATLFIQIISFLILLFLMTKVLYRPLQNLLDERINKVRSDIEDAQRLLAEAEENRRRAQEMLHKAQEEAMLIQRKAEQEADAYYRQQLQRTKEEMEKLLASAQAEIQENVRNAKAELQQEISSISIAVAEKILRREISESEHEQIIREAIEGIVHG